MQHIWLSCAWISYVSALRRYRQAEIQMNNYGCNIDLMNRDPCLLKTWDKMDKMYMFIRQQWQQRHDKRLKQIQTVVRYLVNQAPGFCLQSTTSFRDKTGNVTFHYWFSIRHVRGCMTLAGNELKALMTTQIMHNTPYNIANNTKHYRRQQKMALAK